MNIFRSTTFDSLYKNAQKPEDLPWHREEPWPMLTRVVEARDAPARALDVGCGSGETAVYLASLGYDVTGLDLHERPLQMAEALAREKDVDVTFIQANVLEWVSDGAFDLVLDSGCYHGLIDTDRERYRMVLGGWLSPTADYVLIHFAKKHLLDWRPVGPRRRSRAVIQQEFAPQLRLVDYAEQILHGVRLPVGPRPLVGQYWFERTV